jgi:hypothetical protein
MVVGEGFCGAPLSWRGAGKKLKQQLKQKKKA